jgi:anti-anti-sigma factor
MTPGPGQTAGNVLDATIPARLEEAEAFIGTMRAFLAERGLRAIGFDLELLAREALVNAVLHGCQADPSRSVSVQLSVLPDRVQLRVTDDGAGFDWRNAPKVLPSPTSETGRGLCIMKTYADQVEFNDSGNMVCITKNVPSEEVPMSKDETEGLVQLSLEANISAKNAQELREMFRERVLAGARRLELDFARVESIDSVGIGLLVATHNTLVKAGGSLSLANVGQDIFQLLTLMRLDKHFSISQACAG